MPSRKRPAKSPVSEKPELKKALSDLKKVDDKKKIHYVDEHFGKSGFPLSVYEDYDCMLNQTNINSNNNKFYVIQLIKEVKNGEECFYVWTRWGRVGETGQFLKLGPFSKLKEAEDNFKKKFTSKTDNSWDKRANFSSKPGKYTLIELADEETLGETKLKIPLNELEYDVEPCTLDKPTQDLIQRISSSDTYVHAMKNMNIDVKKMPLGKLSSKQIVKAFEVLDEIQEVIGGKKKNNLATLSSQFFTLVPHSFGRQRPPVIDNSEILREKLNMLLVLSDIAAAQSLTQNADKVMEKKKTLRPNPINEYYDLLECDLQLLSKTEKDFDIIMKFFKVTSFSPCKIINIWRVARHEERERSKLNAKVKNHKLLWHGTNIACLMAILKVGLRIMPHSGGLVGRGLYFASHAQKSHGYVRSGVDGHFLMFLVEVALGKEYDLYESDFSLVKPPDGFDSVVARGSRDFDPNDVAILKLDGQDVLVPSSTRDRMNFKSGFFHNEFVVYDSNLSLIRYIVEYK